MGRLIDADALCKKIREIYDGYMLDEGCCPIEFENMVDEQPTAYNLEDVTEQLTNLSSADADFTLAEDLVDRKEVLRIVLCNKETNN